MTRFAEASNPVREPRSGIAGGSLARIDESRLQLEYRQ
jgi:hypothetical protein